jgi:MoaA/NifB/PqqE/SkfB family radical SAM enzyme
MKISNYIENINDIMRQNTVLKSKPLFWEAVLTWDCNLKCKMCLNGYDKKSEMLNSDSVISFLENNQQLICVEWCGGEPTLHTDFEKFLEIAHGYGIKQSLVTNATRLTESLAKKLVEYNVYVTVSLDAPVKDVFEDIRRGANFETVINNVKLLAKYKKEINNSFKFNIDYVVLKDNYKYMPQMVKFAKDLGTERVFFMSDLSKSAHALQPPQKEEFKNIIEIVKAEGKKQNIEVAIDSELEVFAYNQTQFKPIKEISHGACIVPFQALCIHPDGGAYPALFCSTAIGNINEEVWNSAAMQKYRQNMLNADFSLCKTCESLPVVTKSYRALDRFLKMMIG